MIILSKKTKPYGTTGNHKKLQKATGPFNTNKSQLQLPPIHWEFQKSTVPLPEGVHVRRTLASPAIPLIAILEFLRASPTRGVDSPRGGAHIARSTRFAAS